TSDMRRSLRTSRSRGAPRPEGSAASGSTAGSAMRPRQGWMPSASAGDAGVLELVELGPTGEQVDDALDGGPGAGGVGGTVHEPGEGGLVTRDEGGDAPDVVLGDGGLVLLADGLERLAGGDGGEHR